MEDNEFNKFEDETSISENGEYTNQEVTPKGSKGATASFVLGIISLVATFFWVIHLFPVFVIPYVGLFLGISAAKRFSSDERIKSKAKAGIIMNSISLGLILLTWIIFIVGLIIIASDPVLYENFMQGMTDFMNGYLSQIKSMDPEAYRQVYDMYYEFYPEWFEGISALLCLF